MILVFLLGFFEFPLIFVFKVSLDFLWMDDSGGGAVWFILWALIFLREAVGGEDYLA